ncbi:Protein of unknown function [Propionibacterium freudenreichii]|nr:Protein of unknown function [Propionibacterium freudenreichii]
MEPTATAYTITITRVVPKMIRDRLAYRGMSYSP